MTLSDNGSIAVQLWKDMHTAALGTLEPNGLPHVSLVTVAPQKDGSALLLLSDLARHTANIKRDKRTSLLVQSVPENPDDRGNGDEVQNANTDPLASERITIHGTLQLLPDDQQKNAAVEFVKRHPAAQQYIGFQDFNLYGFQASELFLVGGFGRIETFAAEILAM